MSVYNTWLMTSCIDCSLMPRACSEPQESSRNTLLSRLSEAWMGSANHEKQTAVLSCGRQLRNVHITWMRKRARHGHTRRAGVKQQTRLGRLQQPLNETAGEDGGGEDDGPLGLNLHWFHNTVGDQVVLMTCRINAGCFYVEIRPTLGI